MVSGRVRAKMPSFCQRDACDGANSQREDVASHANGPGKGGLTDLTTPHQSDDWEARQGSFEVALDESADHGVKNGSVSSSFQGPFFASANIWDNNVVRRFSGNGRGA